ncbi:MAG TPA: hypothetical protein GXX15_08675 [Clostridia bacterium]|nr:hypothetical protein [Clostridia bacterium]
MDKIMVKKEEEILQYVSLENKKIILNTIEKNKKTKEILAPDCASDFDLCYDKEGRINLIYYNLEGELIFLIQAEKGWTKKALYTYKDKNTYLSNFNLLIKDKVLHIFFTLSNANNPREVVLIHQKWDKSWSGKNIASIKAPFFTPFYDVFLDNEGNLHLIYTASEKNKSQLYYLFYVKDSWSPKFLISESEKIFYPTLIVDNQKNVHASWVEEDIIQEIKYRKKTPGSWPKGSWNNVTTLAYSTDNKNCCISLLENNLWCSYVQKDSIFATLSSDGGNSWCKPFKLPFSLEEIEFFKIKIPINGFCGNYIFISKKGEIVPLEYKSRRQIEEKNTYFTFYIKEVQEYLNLLIKKLQALKEGKDILEEELNRKNTEIAMKNKNIAELQELLKQANDEKMKIALKADNYNIMVNSLMRENENLKKQIKDLQNQIIILNSKLENTQNTSTFQKIKSLFIKEED